MALPSESKPTKKRRPPRPEPSVERIRELFAYDPETGLVTRRVGSRHYKAGAVVGCRQPKRGYLGVQVDGRRCMVHRIAWVLMRGAWPAKWLDHLNAVGDDNRACNLREATPLQNNRNMRRPPRNTSGFKGVTYRRHRGKWEANIGLFGRVVYLGWFDTAEAAHTAYVEAAKKHHGEFANFGDGPAIAEAA